MSDVSPTAATADVAVARASTPALPVVSRLLITVFAAPAAYLIWASLPWPLIHDAPIMHYIAWRIAQGAVPYRDLFDMNQPGVYAIHLAVVRLLGESDLAWRAVDLATLALAALAIAALARPWGRAAALGGALLFALYHVAGGAWQSGQRDLMLCPLLGWCMVAVARWIDRDAAWRVAIAGIAIGAAITVKPHAALFATALAAVIAVVAHRRGSGIAAPLGAFVAAAALAPLAALGWLASRGAAAAWRDITFGYLVPLYSRLGRPEHWALHRPEMWIAIAAAVGLSLASAAGRRRFTARHGLATIGLAYGVVHFVAQGKGWEYHLYPLAFFAAVLAFSEVDALVRERAVVLVPVCAALVAVAVVLTTKGVDASSAEWIWDKERTVRQLVGDLGPRLRAGETVQVLDTTEGGIHALLRLHVAQPTRFVYDFPFFHDVDAPVIRALRAELVHGLEARPPAFIVVFRWSWPNGSLDRIHTFPELARLLERSYVLVRERERYVIFAQRDHP